MYCLKMVILIGIFANMLSRKSMEIRGEKIMKLYDEIKKNYERGDYDQKIKSSSYYSNPDKLGWSTKYK